MAAFSALDFAGVLAQQEGLQIVLDHRQDGATAAPAGVGVARAFEAIAQPHAHRDQLEMCVRPVFGVVQRVVQRHPPAARFDVFDSFHGRG